MPYPTFSSSHSLHLSHIDLMNIYRSHNRCQLQQSQPTTMMEIDLPRMQSLSPPLDSPSSIDPNTDIAGMDVFGDVPAIADSLPPPGPCDANRDLDLCGCRLHGKTDCGCRYINQVSGSIPLLSLSHPFTGPTIKCPDFPLCLGSYLT